jgi:hypothetical protein
MVRISLISLFPVAVTGPQPSGPQPSGERSLVKGTQPGSAGPAPGPVGSHSSRWWGAAPGPSESLSGLSPTVSDSEPQAEGPGLGAGDLSESVCRAPAGRGVDSRPGWAGPRPQSQVPPAGEHLVSRTRSVCGEKRTPRPLVEEPGCPGAIAAAGGEPGSDRFKLCRAPGPARRTRRAI